MTRSHVLGVAAGIGAALCWGSSTVLSKGLLRNFDSMTLLALQLLSSVAVLWIAVLWTSRMHQPRKVTPSGVAAYAWLGALEPALAYCLCLSGLTAVSAGSATLIQSSESLLIVGVTAVLTRRLPSARFLVTSLVALAALSVALTTPAWTPMPNASSLGIALLGAGTFTAAIYVVLSGRVAHRAPALTLTAWQQSVALAVVMLAWACARIVGSSTHPLAAPNPAAGFRTEMRLVGWCGVSGLLQFALPFSLYMIALRRLTANVAGATLLLIPIVGLLEAHLFLGERLSSRQWAAGIIALAAVAGLAVGSRIRDAQTITALSA